LKFILKSYNLARRLFHNRRRRLWSRSQSR